MRSIKIIFITLLLLAGGFGLYVYLQQPHGNGTRSDGGGPSRPIPPGDQVYRSGTDVWFVHYDRKSGRKSYQFRADTYLPQNDGRVDVVNPRAEFYLSDGNVIRLTGRTGQIAMRELPKAGGGRPVAAPTEPPRRGELKTVRIEFLASSQAAEPVFWVTVDNAAFDMDAFEIHTESATIDGKMLTADMIPVVARGEYEFDGTGLVIRWNQMDQKLSLLEIAHGQRMFIRHPSTAGRRTLGSSPSPLKGEGPVAAVSRPRSGRTQESPATEAGPASSKPATAPADKDLYRAMFERDVRILQGDQQVVLASAMVVDLLMAPAPKATTRPATGPSSVAPVSRPGSDRTQESPATAESQATTKPATEEEPITILWTGKLSVVPAIADSLSPTEPGSAVVKLTGAPVRVTQQKSLITCGTVAYSTADSRLTLVSTPDHPLKMIDAQGSVVHANAMDYSIPARQARFRGDGTATLISRAADGAAETIETSWNKSCTLTLAPAGTDNRSSMAIEHAALAGDVVVRHPRLDMRSGSLDLAFTDAAAPATRPGSRPSTRPGTPQLKTITAGGKVRAVVHEAGKPDQSIEAETLSLATSADPAGKLYFSNLDAAGSVLLVDPARELRAGKLNVVLSPSTRPAQDASAVPLAGGLQVEKLVAQDQVRITTKEKQSVAADQLSLDIVDGEQQVTLLGRPAQVVDADTTITGPLIHVYPQSQKSRISGAGSLKSEKAADRPVELTWDKSANLDVRRDLIEVLGNVKAVSKDDDGTINTITSGRLLISLVDAPPEKPATAGAAAPASAPARTKDTPLLARKTAKLIRFLDDARLVSVRNLPDGQVDRGVAIRGPEIEYELATRQFRVPAAGRMAIESARAGPAEGKAADADFSGATTFQWSKSLVYDEPGKKIVLAGDVVLIHLPQDGNKEKMVRLEAQTMTAHLAAAPGAKRLELERIVADGPIKFVGNTGDITASSVEFDPVKHQLTCRGSDREPVEMFGKDGISTGSFGSLVFDTKTNHIISSTNVSARVPR